MKSNVTKFQRLESGEGFTLLELLTVIAILTLLTAITSVSLATSKQKAREIACLNQLKQISLAAKLYAGENSDFLPPITGDIETSWVYRLSPYLSHQPSILRCPGVRGSDRFTYIINGWNDYWQKHLSAEQFNLFKSREIMLAMQCSAVQLQSETILFGEKNTSSRHVHMDLYQGSEGNDIEEVDEARHRTNKKQKAGSNYAFVDGSVRFIRRGHVGKPVNLWATTEEWRLGPQ